MKKIVWLFAVLLFLNINSCATMQTVKESKGEGIKRTYNHTYNNVYDAALSASKKQGLEIVEANKDEGKIFLSHGITLWSWGERIAIFVTKISDNETEVEVVSKAVLSPLNFPPDWVNRLFNEIDIELKKGESEMPATGIKEKQR